MSDGNSGTRKPDPEVNYPTLKVAPLPPPPPPAAKTDADQTFRDLEPPAFEPTEQAPLPKGKRKIGKAILYVLGIAAAVAIVVAVVYGLTGGKSGSTATPPTTATTASPAAPSTAAPEPAPNGKTWQQAVAEHETFFNGTFLPELTKKETAINGRLQKLEEQLAAKDGEIAALRREVGLLKQMNAAVGDRDDPETGDEPEVKVDDGVVHPKNEADPFYPAE